MNKNKRTNNKKKTAEISSAALTRRIIIIFVCIFVGISLLFGATLGIITAVKQMSYIIYNSGIGIDEGLLNYFIAYYKTVYMKNNGIPGTNDTESYWNKSPYAPATQTTNAQFFKVELEEYLKKLIASNVIFDKMLADCTSGERKEIKSEMRKETEIAMQNVFASLQIESKSEFNERAAEYGFDYSDFKQASEMIYKDYAWPRYIFGTDGSGMINYPEDLQKFLDNYSRIRFIFIRTENTFKKDEDGNRVTENGVDQTVELTESEKAARASHIEKIKNIVAEINSGITDKVSFESEAAKVKNDYGEISDNEINGYYLYSGSKFTSAFAEDFAEVYKVAMTLDIGQGAFVELSADEDAFDGYCFMYRDENEEDIYTMSESEDGFFSDLYLLAAASLYSEMIDAYDDFESKDSWAEVSIINIPYMKYIQNFVPQFYS